MKLRTIVIICLMLFSILPVTSQADERTAARKELFGLLQERQKLFDNYSQTIKKKSGFFGNRTKNDMRASHATLQEIVEIDNKIMNSLERVIDTKNYEKTTMSFDVSEYQERINNLSKVNDVTLTQNEKLEKETKYLNRFVLRMKFYFVFLILIIIGLLYWMYRMRKLYSSNSK
ncbi:MAG: hypothetical protein ACO1G9_00675 [Bacteroidota bacterium]